MLALTLGEVLGEMLPVPEELADALPEEVPLPLIEGDCVVDEVTLGLAVVEAVTVALHVAEKLCDVDGDTELREVQ